MGELVQLRPIQPAAVAGLLWELLKGDLPPGTTKAAWLAFMFTGVSCLGVFAGGELIGAIGYRGDNLHMAIRPEWRGRWFSARISREIVDYGLRRRPRLVAIIKRGDRLVQRMAAGSGFVLASEDGDWQRWTLHRAG